MSSLLNKSQPKANKREKKVQSKKREKDKVNEHSASEPSFDPIAEAKLQALNEVHTQKVRSLMRSITQLKDQIATIKGQDNEHRRSALIQKLRKDQRELELIIDVLKEALRQKAPEFNESSDQVREFILKKTIGGPKRFRPKTREELEIDLQAMDKKYKRISASLKESKHSTYSAKSRF